MDSFRNKLKSNLWTLGACDKLLAQKWNVDEVLLLQEKSTFNADAICETKRWSQPPLELNGYDYSLTTQPQRLWEVECRWKQQRVLGENIRSSELASFQMAIVASFTSASQIYLQKNLHWWYYTKGHLRHISIAWGWERSDILNLSHY